MILTKQFHLPGLYVSFWPLCASNCFLRASIILGLGVLQTSWWFSNTYSVDCVVMNIIVIRAKVQMINEIRFDE